MKKRNNIPDKTVIARPQVTLNGVALVMGLPRTTAYSRLAQGRLNLDGIPRQEKRTGTLYDLQAVFRRMAPDADDNTISLLMFRFIQEHGRVIK